jgi:hypothetical protein
MCEYDSSEDGEIRRRLSRVRGESGVSDLVTARNFVDGVVERLAESELHRRSESFANQIDRLRRTRREWQSFRVRSIDQIKEIQQVRQNRFVPLQVNLGCDEAFKLVATQMSQLSAEIASTVRNSENLLSDTERQLEGDLRTYGGVHASDECRPVAAQSVGNATLVGQPAASRSVSFRAAGKGAAENASVGTAQ